MLYGWYYVNTMCEYWTELQQYESVWLGSSWSYCVIVQDVLFSTRQVIARLVQDE